MELEQYMLNTVVENEAYMWKHLTFIHSQILMQHLSIDTMTYEIQALPSRISPLSWWDRKVKRQWQYSGLRKKLWGIYKLLWDCKGGEHLLKLTQWRESKAGQGQTQDRLPSCAPMRFFATVHREVKCRLQLHEEDEGKREHSNLSNLNFMLKTWWEAHILPLLCESGCYL